MVSTKTMDLVQDILDLDSRSKVASIGGVSQLLCFAMSDIPPHKSHIFLMTIGFSLNSNLPGWRWVEIT